MRIYIKEIDNITAGEFLMKDPQLCAMGLGDQFLKDFDNGLGYNPQDGALTGFFTKKDGLISFIQASLFTESTILVHGFLNSKLHHTGIFRKIADMYVKYIHRDHPAVKKIMVMSPSVCKHVHNAITGLGFVKEGCLTQSIVWRERLTDVFIFGRALLTNDNVKYR